MGRARNPLEGLCLRAGSLTISATCEAAPVTSVPKGCSSGVDTPVWFPSHNYVSLPPLAEMESSCCCKPGLFWAAVSPSLPPPHTHSALFFSFLTASATFWRVLSNRRFCFVPGSPLETIDMTEDAWKCGGSELKSSSLVLGGKITLTLRAHWNFSVGGYQLCDPASLFPWEMGLSWGFPWLWITPPCPLPLS